MHKRFICLLFMVNFIGIVVWSCDSPPSENKIEQVTKEYQLPGKMAELYTIVGAKHDTAMLLMGDIRRTQQALRSVLSEQKGLAKEKVLDALTALQRADDGMMTWMHEFKSTELNEEEYQALSEAEIKAYLEKEEKKIEQVHVDMTTSIATGKLLLEQLQ